MNFNVFFLSNTLLVPMEYLEFMKTKQIKMKTAKCNRKYKN